MFFLNKRSGNHFIELAMTKMMSAGDRTRRGNPLHEICIRWRKSSWRSFRFCGWFSGRPKLHWWSCFLPCLCSGEPLPDHSADSAEMTHYCEGSADWGWLINRNHNHAELKDGLWIHRKGATHAETGMMGVIPGNMRDGSFIVEGKGNPAALWSSSHGAGRILGRKAAQRDLSRGTVHWNHAGNSCQGWRWNSGWISVRVQEYFDVMRRQSNMVEITHHIRPLINIKG